MTSHDRSTSSLEVGDVIEQGPVDPVFFVGFCGMKYQPRLYSHDLDTWLYNHGEYMGVSKNNGFSPQIIHSGRVFHYKPSILGYPYFWKRPYKSPIPGIFWASFQLAEIYGFLQWGGRQLLTWISLLEVESVKSSPTKTNKSPSTPPGKL